MDNHTDEWRTRQINLDKAKTWLADAKTWIELAEKLTSENAGAPQDSKLNVANTSIGLAFQITYNSLLVAEAKWPRENASIKTTHNRLQRETQTEIEECMALLGCDADDILNSLDNFMNEYFVPTREPLGAVAPTAEDTAIANARIPIEILHRLFCIAEASLTDAEKTGVSNQPNPGKDLDAVLAKINEIVKKSEGGAYLYRGEPERYNKVSSTLYRHYEDYINGINVRIDTIQREMLREVKRYTRGRTNFEILTQLQHFGGKTNLIDFTTDYLIALFFACDGSLDNDGRIVILKDTEKSAKKLRIKRPRNPENRIIAQKSVFVRPRKGFIELNADDVIEIPRHLKKPMIEYLDKHHDISSCTIYNDLHGFIKHQDSHARADVELFKGLASFNNKEYTKAIWHYTEALRYIPQWPIVYYHRGLVHLEAGSNDYAIKDFDKAVELIPDYAGAYNIRGKIYWHMGLFDRAMEDFDKAIELKPGYTKAHYNRGLVNCEKGDYDLAIRDFSRAIELKPRKANAYVERGMAYCEKDNFDRAIEDFDKAIALKPRKASIYMERGLAHCEKDEFDRGIQDFSNAIELKPNKADAYFNRGLAHYDKGEYALAVSDLDTAVSIDPDSPDAYCYRGLAHLHLKDWKRAKSDLETAVDKGEDIAEAFSDSYDCTAEFVKNVGVELPQDIAAMLQSSKESNFTAG